MTKPPPLTHVDEVFGPCPDCEGGRCTENCGPATVDAREIITAAVLEMEATQHGHVHAAIMRMMRRIGPPLPSSVMERYTARNGTPPMVPLGRPQRKGDDNE